MASGPPAGGQRMNLPTACLYLTGALIATMALSQCTPALAVSTKPITTQIPLSAKPITTQSLSRYAGVLSKPKSVTPQRHCGFFAPVIRLDSQTRSTTAQRAAAPIRLQSVYDGWIRPNTTPLWGNRSSGTVRPRVAPVTLSDSQSERAITQNLTGGLTHG